MSNERPGALQLPLAQLELPHTRAPVPDRNADKGGRSFYFFDFDDNVMRLDTHIFLFHRDSGEERALSTRAYAEVSHLVGRAGRWRDYELRLDDRNGSFRRFRDLPALEREGREQPFLEDLGATLRRPRSTWRGPSWELFYHAIYNQRPVAIITARGHHPDTLCEGLELLERRGYLPARPNYLGVFTVSHREVRRALGDPEARVPVPQLKRVAILRAVETAMACYGRNPYHRFGMSDDDPTNIAWILEAMRELKQRYPDNAFFVIDTNQSPLMKTEVLLDRDRTAALPATEQLALFPRAPVAGLP